MLDAFFKVDEATVSHEQFDGSMSEPRPVLIFERGDAVAALLYDPDRRKVITVNQFRFPAHKKDGGSGWLVEAVAGMIHDGQDGTPAETPMQCLIREVKEETGYEIAKATLVSKFFSSPGGSTELIHLYYAEVRRPDKKSEGGGVKAEGEDIEVVEFGIEDFFAKLAAGDFKDPKLIIAGQWLMASRSLDFFARLEGVRSRKKDDRAEFDPTVSRTIAYKVMKGEGRILGIKTGDIKAVRGADAWVNSENTDMMMDRFFGKSVSASIRYLGAEKDQDGIAIKKDTIGRALTSELGERNYVEPGYVIETTSGELAKHPYYVKGIFHVASVRGQIGAGLRTSLSTVQEAMDNILAKIEAARRYRSVLVPLLATGQGDSPMEQVAPILVDRALAFFSERSNTYLKEIYFLAYTSSAKELLESLLRGKTVGADPALSVT